MLLQNVVAREILLYFSYLHNSNWDEMSLAIKNGGPIESDLLNKAKKEAGNNYVTILDDNYPKFLKNTIKPPIVLFFKGNFELLNSGKKFLSIVGSRNCTEYGTRICKEIVADLDDDYVIVSGLAKGIDAIAHQAALDNNIKTIGILGGGFNKFYPKENQNLAEEIIRKGGLVLSEYPFNYDPKQENFSCRNRLIAAICDYLLVCEAYSRSGTSITVNHAICMGRDVGCIPYPYDKNSACNLWIKEGAWLVESSKDIIDVIKSKKF